MCSIECVRIFSIFVVWSKILPILYRLRFMGCYLLCNIECGPGSYLLFCIECVYRILPFVPDRVWSTLNLAYIFFCIKCGLGSYLLIFIELGVVSYLLFWRERTGCTGCTNSCSWSCLASTYLPKRNLKAKLCETIQTFFSSLSVCGDPGNFSFLLNPIQNAILACEKMNRQHRFLINQIFF